MSTPSCLRAIHISLWTAYCVLCPFSYWVISFSYQFVVFCILRVYFCDMSWKKFSLVISLSFDFAYGFCHAGSFYEIELMDLSFYCFWILNHRKAFLIPALQRNLLGFSCVYVMVSINVYIFDPFRICTEVYCEVSPTLSFFQIAVWLSQKSYVYSTDLDAFIACKIARCLWGCFWKFYSITFLLLGTLPCDSISGV